MASTSNGVVGGEDAGGADVTAADVGKLASLRNVLPFQRRIIHSLIPGSGTTNDGDASKDNDMAAATADDEDDPDVLLVLARGLGLRTIIASVLRLYDGPSNLVLVLNATADEETGLSEELTTMGVRKPGLQSIGHETNARIRQEQYLSGGLLSVTSRILIVDMLEQRIPIDLITGIVVMHAENVTPNCIENFVIVLYREHNKDGFLKAFSDSPDFFAWGTSPLQTTLTQLLIRRVELWPRFHKQVIKDLGRRKADVIELRQDLSPAMRQIQNALVECLSATLAELNRGSGAVDIEDATIENAIFKDFERIVRSQLSRVWNRVGPKTKRMLDDLRELRKLIDFLLSYDAVRFNRYLETILLTQQRDSKNGMSKQLNSLWVMEEAANVIFSKAKARSYSGDISKALAAQAQRRRAAEVTSRNDGIDPEEEAALLEAINERSTDSATTKKRPSWLPPGIEPTLEEQPKWHLLRQVLDEIEQDIHASTDLTATRNDTVLIMVADEFTCMQIREFLATMKSSNLGRAGKDSRPGKRMMERQLRNYFEWKQNVGRMSNNLRNPKFASTTAAAGTTMHGNAAAQNGAASKSNYESEALRRKEHWEGGRAPLHKRRRQRGGSVMGGASSRRDPGDAGERLEMEASEMEEYMQKRGQEAIEVMSGEEDDEDSEDEAAAAALANVYASNLDHDFATYFGLLRMEELIIVRAYAGDDDDNHLQELKPRFVVMYDPDPAFIRRLEVYRTCQATTQLRIYFLMYTESVEEQRYLSQIRREKESFERLIREKATMALTLHADGRYADAATDHDRNLRIINSRAAGGQGAAASASREPPRVIVDMREFRSDLPFMLYKAGIRVVPRTLQVGDYILSDKMCVERKSPSDLVQSLISGRLYTQCEMMTVHYDHPILLIEFEENKSFSMQTLNETKTGARMPPGMVRSIKPQEMDVQAKLVMLTQSFPRLRLIWSSSPSQTSEIFAELKKNYDEPDASQSAAIGMSEGGAEGAAAAAGKSNGHANEAQYNMTPQDVLLALPGITSKNYLLVSRSVRDLAELCDMTQEEISHLIGVEAGRKLFTFIHASVQSR